jgi:hypothetical protein
MLLLAGCQFVVRTPLRTDGTIQRLPGIALANRDGQLLTRLQYPQSRGAQGQILRERSFDQRIQFRVAKGFLPPSGICRHSSLNASLGFEPVVFDVRGGRLVVVRSQGGAGNRTERREPAGPIP